MLAVVLAACGGSKAPAAQPTSAPVPVKAAPTGQAGIDLLLGAMRAQLAQKAFRMNMTTEDIGRKCGPFYDMSNVISQLLSPETVEDLAKNITVEKMKFVGPDLIDGKPMWVYQYETSMDLVGTKINSAAKVWLGVLDKLPYKQEGESDSIVNKGSKTKSTIVYEYDPNIKIEAPIQS